MNKAILKIFNKSQVLAIALWLFYIICNQTYPDFISNYFMSFTMLFASLIAGASSEGGGAVAFPVMTLLYDISPKVARDFSLIIQTFGMGCAAYTIFRNKIPVALNYIFVALAGSFCGQALGFLFFEQIFSPVLLKISFTSLWMSFALVLFLQLKKPVKTIDDVVLTHVNLFGLLFFSILGGIFTALTGSGVDILTYSFAVLFLGISEKKATPSSVVIMAVSSFSAVILKGFLPGVSAISSEAISYWLVCVPVVIFGAPLGALVISFCSRAVIIYLLQISIIVQFIYSLIILDLGAFEKICSALILVFGSLLFYSLWWLKYNEYLEKIN